jgi:predicted nucleic acid-binding protein
MILADTSIWVDHLRKGDNALVRELENCMILCHPFVVGELALGNLANREEILFLVDRLPRARTASDSEVMTLIENKRLMGRAIGWVDAHLLASTLLSPPAKLWTRDKKLRLLAAELGVALVS